MKRRKFILASGSTVLASSGLGYLSRSAVGLEFELEPVPNKKPSNINSLLVDFSRFKLKPRYISKSEDITVTINLTLDGINSKEVQADIPVKQRIDKSDISEHVPLMLDGIDTSQSVIDGRINITVQHSDIGEKAYHQSFTVTENPLVDGLVAYYPMEKGEGEIIQDGALNNLAQIKSGNSGGNTSATDMWDSGKLGSKALNFDGSDDHVIATDVDVNKFSISAWIYPHTTSPQWQGIMTKKDPSVNTGTHHGMQLKYDGLRGQISDGSTHYWVGSDGIITSNEWQHVVFTFDGSTGMLFRNAEIKKQENHDFIQSENNLKWTIGVDGGYDNNFDGKIDDVRVYDRALSQSEIETLYNLTETSGQLVKESDIPSNDDGGISRYEFEKDLTDSWSTNDGTDNTDIGYSEGVYGQSKSFDGDTDYVTLGTPTAFDLGTASSAQATYSAWVKPEEVATNRVISAQSKNESPLLNFRLNSDNTIQILIDDSDGTRMRTAAGSYTAGEWIFMSFVLDHGEVRLFQNGELVSTESTSLTGHYNWSEVPQEHEIGTFTGTTGSEDLYGDIDDVRIYDVALSASEVEQLFNKGSYQIE